MPEFIPQPRSPKTSYEINPRFSLNNGAIEHDLRTHNAREVVYTPGNPDQESLRHRLEAAHLILGYAISGAPDRNTYEVPIGARSLALETPMETGSPFAYGDRRLMHDLGRLTARIGMVSGGLIIAAPAERAFAVTDFVEPGNEHITAAPGLEKLLVPARSVDAHLSEQLGAFSAEFGERFASHVADFTTGYNAAALERRTV